MEQGFILSGRAKKRTEITVRRVLGALPRVPKITRRVFDGGGSGERVRMRIDSYNSSTGVAVCSVKYRSTGTAAVTGESVSGKINVLDPAGCFFNEDAYDLVNRWGDADLMYPIAAIDSYQDPVWIVSGLCCPPA